jgi:phospholipid/cholesterol/gamma-HCH transport system substrate-binding protein
MTVVIVVAFLLIKESAKPNTSASIVRARLSDIRGIPTGAPVTIAGLKVGTIVERRVGSGYAEIDIQFESNIELREDATLFKRRTSLLSGPSLEIDPGTSEDPLPTKYIERVVETSNIGDILHDISEALPALSSKAEDGVAQTENLRAKVNGPFREVIENFDESAKDIHKRMHSRLEKIDDRLKDGEAIDFDAKAAIEPRLTRAKELTEYARDQLGSAREWVSRSAASTRNSIDESELNLSPYADPVRDIDEGKGTLGKLLNSDELHGDMVEITGDVRRFFRSVADWQMRVGLRGEFSLRSGEPRAYVTLKAGRSDRYFYVELLASPQGAAPDTQVAYDNATGLWRRDISISSGLRFTAQWARRLGPMVFRYGMKESTFGAGADFQLIDERLELSVDVFEFAQEDQPHLKVAATYRVFGQLFILAGLDDVLNPGRNYTIAPIATEVPTNLDTIYLGRDYYLGATLRFTDRDLAGLLRIGGDALGALVTL